jgi:acyl dehydratase
VFRNWKFLASGDLPLRIPFFSYSILFRYMQRSWKLGTENSSARRRHYGEDFVPGVIYESPLHTISEEEALEFASRYDPQDFHLDSEAAKSSLFGRLVCGWIPYRSVSWALALKSGKFDDCTLAGLGAEELRWLIPVQPGATLQCRFTMINWRRSSTQADAGVSRMRFELFTREGRLVFTTVVRRLLLRLRPIETERDD